MPKETESEYYARPEERRRCPITGELVTYEQFCKAGSLVVAHNSLAAIRKKMKLTNEQMREHIKTLIHSSLTGGYYASPKKYLIALGQDYEHSEEEKEAEYDKLIRPSTRCSFPGCEETVPYGLSHLCACSVNHYNAATSIRQGKAKLEDYTYKCELCNAVFTSNYRLTRHLTEEHKLSLQEQEDYYNKYIRQPGDPDGYCKWCGKKLEFVTIGTGYRSFCHNTDCSVRWYNEHEGRHTRAGETLKATASRGDVMVTQKGYWLKQGMSDEEASAKIKEIQTTNSVEAIMKREGVSREEAVALRQDITKKWLDNRVTGLRYSKVSQELFWKIWDTLYPLLSTDDVYFATFDKGERTPEGSQVSKEYRIKTNRSYRMADFYIDSLDLSIEFDGAWFHGLDGKSGWRDAEFDNIRDTEILDARPGHKILHVAEMDYRKNEAAVVEKCCAFILGARIQQQAR